MPDDDKQAERIARQAKMYVLIDEDFYWQRECGVKLRYISREEGLALLVGICALEAIIFQCKHETGPVMNNSNVVGYVIRLWNHSLKLFFTV